MQMRQADIDMLAAIMYRDIAAWIDQQRSERGEKDENDRIPTFRLHDQGQNEGHGL